MKPFDESPLIREEEFRLNLMWWDDFRRNEDGMKMDWLCVN